MKFFSKIFLFETVKLEKFKNIKKLKIKKDGIIRAILLINIIYYSFYYIIKINI